MSFAPVTAADRNALGTNPNFADLDREIDAGYGTNRLSAYYIDSTTQVRNADLPVTPLVNNVADGTYWYIFTRDGGTLAMQYSTDGINFATALTASLENPTDPFNEFLISGTTYERRAPTPRSTTSTSRLPLPSRVRGGV